MSETTPPVDLSKLITIRFNATVNDTLMQKSFFFRRQEQYQYDKRVSRLEGCGPCGKQQEQVNYYQVTIAGLQYLLRPDFVIEDRTLREAEYTFEERLESTVRTVPDGGFSQFDNYYPKQMLQRMNAYFKDRKVSGVNRGFMTRKTP